ncbi:uncharacterized protein ColSpa_03053 [Colletotrichum spaethianum]|uniref:Uncharacterized protein n=1 Tax=Colletotrichum spaethianum TaxID=700344 RepID=A0AA37L6R1_9PEZI|nr:uncharacterized protein ColSpa_03053 [Colletotrichum spaethianum]GKT42872.1 hypothetical protein ColSpa_03053 [Colletotrichum spaethianum]
MADTQPPADANVGWQELKTSNGAKYQVKANDYEISDKPAPTDDELSARGPEFSDVRLNWGTHTSGAPPQDVQDKTGITWYNLNKAPWYSVFKWRLTINVKDTYNYVFTDQSGDTYSLGTWQLGTHTVDYDSSEPTIVSISGN